MRNRLDHLKPVSSTKECFKDYWSIRFVNGISRNFVLLLLISIPSYTHPLARVGSHDLPAAPEDLNEASLARAWPGREAATPTSEAKLVEVRADVHALDNGAVNKEKQEQEQKSVDKKVKVKVSIKEDKDKKVSENPTVKEKTVQEHETSQGDKVLSNNVEENNLRDLEEKLKTELVKIGGSKLDTTISDMNEIRNKNTENVTLLKQKKKSLSLNRKSVKYSYDDLQNMFLQEEQKVMDIVKVSKKISSELQQGSDGNSTPPSEAEHEEVSEEWTYL